MTFKLANILIILYTEATLLSGNKKKTYIF